MLHGVRQPRVADWSAGPARSCRHRTGGGPLDLTVVSNSAEAVTGDEDLAPESATLLGLTRAAGQEHAWLACRAVDVSDHELGHAAWLAGQLVAEARSGSLSLSAWRTAAGSGWSLASSRLRPARTRRPGGAGPPKADGATSANGSGKAVATSSAGGLHGAGIGASIARHLAGAFGAKLGLIEDHDAAALGTGLEAIRARARRSRRAHVAGCVRWEARLGGSSHGVVYASAIDDGDLLGGIGELGVADVVASLLRHDCALPALEAALSGLSLDFCVVGSSLSAVLGGRGLGAYAACNLFATPSCGGTTSDPRRRGSR